MRSALSTTLTTLRGWSCIVATVAFAPAAWLVAEAGRVEHDMSLREAHGQFACGMGSALLFGGVMLAAGVALLGSLLALASWWRVPRPRPRGRHVELAVFVALPFAFLLAWWGAVTLAHLVAPPPSLQPAPLGDARAAAAQPDR
jgi:hypothetical protein